MDRRSSYSFDKVLEEVKEAENREREISVGHGTHVDQKDTTDGLKFRSGFVSRLKGRFSSKKDSDKPKKKAAKSSEASRSKIADATQSQKPSTPPTIDKRDTNQINGVINANGTNNARHSNRISRESVFFSDTNETSPAKSPPASSLRTRRQSRDLEELEELPIRNIVAATRCIFETFVSATEGSPPPHSEQRSPSDAFSRTRKPSWSDVRSSKETIIIQKPDSQNTLFTARPGASARTEPLKTERQEPSRTFSGNSDGKVVLVHKPQSAQSGRKSLEFRSSDQQPPTVETKRQSSREKEAPSPIIQRPNSSTSRNDSTIATRAPEASKTDESPISKVADVRRIFSSTTTTDNTLATNKTFELKRRAPPTPPPSVTKSEPNKSAPSQVSNTKVRLLPPPTNISKPTTPSQQRPATTTTTSQQPPSDSRTAVKSPSPKSPPSRSVLFPAKNISTSNPPSAMSATSQGAASVSKSLTPAPYLQKSNHSSRTSPSTTTVSNSTRTSTAPQASESKRRSDPSTWDTWEDIPVPKRKTFVSEGRRVVIPANDLKAIRKTGKSWVFTTDTANVNCEGSIPVQVEPAVSPSSERSPTSFSYSSEPTMSKARQAQTTFWDSYRTEDLPSTQDRDLVEEARRIMARKNSSEPSSPTVTSSARPGVATPAVNGSAGFGLKSSFRRPGSSHGHIVLHFATGDALLSVFEYQSEESMLAELGITAEYDWWRPDDSSDEADQTDHVPVTPAITDRLPSTESKLSAYRSKVLPEYSWGQNSTSAVIKPHNPPTNDTSPSPDLSIETIPKVNSWSERAHSEADLLF